MADETEGKTEQELEQEMTDALDFGTSIDESLGSHEQEEEVVEAKETEEEVVAADDVEASDQVEETEVVATEEAEESTEEVVDEDGDVTYTLDGKKYTAEEISSDPKLLAKLATHYNQVGHHQKLTDEQKGLVTERDAQIVQLEAEKQRIEQEWTRKKMEEDFAQRKAAETKAEEPAPERPSSELLKTNLKPYLAELKEAGRLTEDELDEHSGLISEYIYDTMETRNIIQEVAAYFAKKIENLEGFVNPAIETWDREQAIRADVSVQKDAAAIEGYEEIADPEQWEKLKAYITSKITSSPKDAEGNPLFNPVFDAETMAEQFDAMQGKDLRAALGAKKKQAVAAKKADAKKAGGSSSGGGKIPKKKPVAKKPKTESEDAMDWGDGRYAS